MSEVELQRQINQLKDRLDELERQEYAMAQNHGWVGAAWQKDPIRFGYSELITEGVDNTSLAAGSNNLDTGTVPAGEIWVITNIAIRYDGTVSSVSLTVALIIDTVLMGIFGQKPPVSTVWYDRQGWWVLDAGDYIRLEVGGATMNDDAYLRVVGFRVDIDQ